jgi:pimeloyl-ACP methyl ester carboxylesterase
MAPWALVAVLLLLGACWLVGSWWFDRQRIFKGLAARAAEGALVQTARGVVECARVGAGPTLLALHASPGGWDRGLASAQDFLGEGFTVLSPSRPGALRTPLDGAERPEDAADQLVALLDALGVDRVAVLAWQHAGPTAIQLALRHPSRVWAVVLESAVTGATPALGVGAGPLARGLQGNLSVWRTETRLHALVRALPLAPRWALRWVLGATLAAQGPREDELIDELLETPGQLKRLTGLLRCLGPLAPRRPGWENDLRQQAVLQSAALEAIEAPVLLVHGVLDPIVPLEHATRVAHRAPRAELMLLDRAGHLVWLGRAGTEVRAKELDFLWRHAPKQTSGPPV